MPASQSDPVTDILAAARRCYLRDGLSGTGMKEVAAQAGIAASAASMARRVACPRVIISS